MTSAELSIPSNALQESHLSTNKRIPQGSVFPTIVVDNIFTDSPIPLRMCLSAAGTFMVSH